MIEFFYHTVWKWQPFWLDEGKLRERWRGKENLRGGRRVPTCLCPLSQPDHRSSRKIIEITAKWYKTERHGHFSHGESQKPEDPFMSCPAPRQQSQCWVRSQRHAAWGGSLTLQTRGWQILPARVTSIVYTLQAVWSLPRLNSALATEKQP